MTDRAPLTVLDSIPPWADPWHHPEYFRGISRKRILAYLVDLVVVTGLAAAAWVGFGILGLATFGLLLPLQALAVAAVPLLYHILLIAGRRSATLGMRMMGIRVLDLSSSTVAGSGRPTLFQAMIQTVAFYGSVTLTSFLILVVALFNPRRRMIHDWLAGTVVVNDPGRSPPPLA